MTSKRSGASGTRVPGSAPEPALPPSREPEPEQLDLIAWLAEQQRLEAERGTKAVEAEAETALGSQDASEATALMDGAALLLRREDPGQNMRRFYRLSVARSLWGEWGVVRQWGRAGTQGQLRTHWHGEQEAAKTERRRIERAKRRRGTSSAGPNEEHLSAHHALARRLADLMEQPDQHKRALAQTSTSLILSDAKRLELQRNAVD